MMPESIPQAMKDRSLNIYIIVFALSGFTGLIYESVWTHYLKLFLGHAAYAQALVLAIFMGGMALGACLCSRCSLRWNNLLVGYAVAEGGIGLFALFFHPVFDGLTQLSYSSVLPAIGSPVSASLFKWILSSLLILPPAVLLGMTFPLMTAGILRLRPQKSGSFIALLYFVNTFGGAFGVLASGFFLISVAGLPGTIRFAGAINIALALIVWRLAREREVPVSTSRGEEAPLCRNSTVGGYRLLLIAALVTGTASFIYEMAWIRMLSLVLGSSTHAFELMLSAFLFGLAFGGLWIRRRIDRLASPVTFLASVQIVMGILAISSLFFYGQTFELMQWLVNSLSKTEGGYFLFNFSSHALALAVMLPATFCAGMTLPLITAILVKHENGEKAIGAVYGINTIGAIVGVFFAIHFGFPLLGLKNLIALGAGLDIALGVVLFWKGSKEGKSRLRWFFSVAGLGAVAATILFADIDAMKMASGVYRHGDLISPDYIRLLYHEDGKTATVSVTHDSSGVTAIRTNGKSDGGINMGPAAYPSPDELTTTLLAVIPMALHSEARTAANIGMGTGLTSHTLLQNPRLSEVDTIEIERNMVEGAKFFGRHVEGVFKDPRSKIYIEDAKTFFATRNKTYDIIVSEPSNPWVSGVAGLFSEEFYRQVSRHLNDGGLFAQWLQLYEIETSLVMSVFKAFSPCFSDFVVYAANDTDILIIAKKEGFVPSLDPDFLKTADMATALKKIRIHNAQDIEFRKVGNKKVLAPLLETFPTRANSDYYPVLDQNAARARYLEKDAKELLLSHSSLPVMEILMGTAPLSEETNITFDHLFTKTRAAAVAVGLRDYFLHGEQLLVVDSLPADVRRDAVFFRSIFHEGGTSPPPERRLDVFFDIALMMIPYLTADELDAIWKNLESGSRADSLSQTEKNFIELFKSIGARDGQKMAKYARRLLNEVADVHPFIIQYLVAAGMLGYILEEDLQGSMSLWEEYKDSLYGEEEPHMLFRLLLAHSEAA